MSVLHKPWAYVGATIDNRLFTFEIKHGKICKWYAWEQSTIIKETDNSWIVQSKELPFERVYDKDSDDLAPKGTHTEGPNNYSHNL